MKLEEFLRAKRWNTVDLSEESGVAIPVLRKILNGTGSLNLDTALKICHATGDKVSPWDLSCNAESIMDGTFLKEKRKKQKDKNDREKNND